MKTLSELVRHLLPLRVINSTDVTLTGVACQPEEAGVGGLYGVIDEFLEYGHWIEGTRLLTPAVLARAAALLTATPLPVSLPQIVVAEARQALAQAARWYYDAPDEGLRIVGVTGTNGKTTVTHLINQWLSACGERSAALGTLGLHVSSEPLVETVYTTPLAPTLFRLLAELRNNGVGTLAMEVSSHALKLDRVYGLDVDVAVFTNLSRDHLDFHGTMEDYQDSKQLLFSRLKPAATAVLNDDDPVGREFAGRTAATVLRYGVSARADLQATQVRYGLDGTRLEVRYGGQTAVLATALVGAFNVANVLAALGAALALGIPLAQLAATCGALHGVPGRLQRVPLPGGRTGIVDYAHSPDSLEQVLQTLRALEPARILTVFGCGGNRDRGKRPLMGAVAARASDLCIVTSDNPRREDPEAIIRDILEGMPATGVLVEPDRRAAIRKAFTLSRAGDVLLLAGKGHEPYQIVGDEKLPFSDYAELQELK